jgi:hypothetical protein
MLMTTRMTHPAFAVAGAGDALKTLSQTISDAERAALALTEALTRIAEQVPDAIWDAAAEHFEEAQLGALVPDIATRLEEVGGSSRLDQARSADNRHAHGRGQPTRAKLRGLNARELKAGEEVELSPSLCLDASR